MMNEIGLLGLGVMGKSLARNFASKNKNVSVYNASLPNEEDVTQDFVKKYSELSFYGAKDLKDFVHSLQKSRIILLMIKSGDPVDEMIDKLMPLLDRGDLIIDAGNSFYKDTQRRYAYLLEKGIDFVGMGVSGGEEGALKGPSIMPAGSEMAKERLMPLLEMIAAQKFNEPCVKWLGIDGAGHFVKMVHNGIEYADMQILSEAYGICRFGAKMPNDDIAKLFEDKFNNFHDSYLLEITINILRKKEGDIHILDSILDVAGHKGTGMWTSRAALELGVAIPTISAAMNQRIISAYKDLRVSISKNSFRLMNIIQEEVLQEVLGPAVLSARLSALAEGFHLMHVASNHYNWNLKLENIAKIWSGGCIIRSSMLAIVEKAYRDYSEDHPNQVLAHLFLDETYQMLMNNNIIALSGLLSSVLMGGDIATPCLSAAQHYTRSMGSILLPINMIQAQRDYFGAHSYKTIQEPTISVHTIWK